jgi:hypothetical protein
LIHNRASWCIANQAILSAMLVVLFPLAPAVLPYRLAFGYTPLLALGHEPTFLPCIAQDASPLNLLPESAQ